MDFVQLSERMESRLALDSPPVAIAFVDRPPDGIEQFDGSVPSSCTFWRRAETGVFYADAEAHRGCPIGAMVMGFPVEGSLHDDLMATVTRMVESFYLGPDEPQRLPAVTKPKSGIVYGPLRDFPVEPDLVLLWLTPAQAMLFAEAAGTVSWTNLDNEVFGRPACAALPIALEASRAALSLGCKGMRTFTEISEDRMLAVLPGGEAIMFCDSLDRTAEANETMLDYYAGRKEEFTNPSAFGKGRGDGFERSRSTARS